MTPCQRSYEPPQWQGKKEDDDGGVAEVGGEEERERERI
jgi:hypothetical protein